jgi:hypothetical protein
MWQYLGKDWPGSCAYRPYLFCSRGEVKMLSLLIALIIGLGFTPPDPFL